ncbi:MAG TPA: class I SAM-dependent methyltransferase [Burkholderiales bacterium]|nr:class I SAM-dependent methyltransferase [Burkholderiales bacterium]
MRLAPIAVLAACAGLAIAQAPHTHEHAFENADKWAEVFDDPKRDGWQKPHEVIQALALKPDAIVADIGAGTGYFSVRFAHLLPKAKIYAVDVEPDMVQHLAARAKREQLSNVMAVQAAPDDPKLPQKVDLAFLVDTYHHIDDRVGYFSRLKASLAPQGRIAIIDFTLDSEIGPPPRARMEPEQVKRELTRAGFKLADERLFLPNQYFLVFSALP